MAKRKKKGTIRTPRKRVRPSSKAGALLESALNVYAQGSLSKALKLLKKAHNKFPGDETVLFHLGNLTKESCGLEHAIVYYRKAVGIAPDYLDALFNLGGALLDSGQYLEAADTFEKVISMVPDYTSAYLNLAIAANALENKDKALMYYQKALELEPENTDVHYCIGTFYYQNKNSEKARDSFSKALAINPGHTDSLFNMASLLQNHQKYDEALQYYEKLIAVAPDAFVAIDNMGLIYQEKRDFEKAEYYFEKALSIYPEYPNSHMNLGNIHRHFGRSEQAIAAYKRSVEIEPSLIALSNLSGYLKELCWYDEVMDYTNQMLSFDELNKAELAVLHDTYIQFCDWENASQIITRFRNADMLPEARDVLAGSFMEFCAITDLSLDEIAELHQQWGRWTEENACPFTHDADTWRRKSDQKIRIGYISPDLREHSVGYLIKDIITSHNYKDFEVYCYANFDPSSADAFTQEIINNCTVLKYVFHLSDKEVAEEIRKDNIQIAIDLAGHTAGHRLRSLAYKPAPIQMTYLGYPHTTGLSRIDYRITDRFAETDVSKDYRYSENLLKLTNCFLTFKGFGDIVPAEIKENDRGKIIFGCFNNIQKLQPKAVELWSKILSQVKNSELHLKAKQLNTPLIWKNISREFAKHGISEERIKCLGYSPTKIDHLKLYNTLDIALDPFPYNGTVTTLEALWMNMPVITLVGESHAQRVSYSILKNLNLDILIATTEEEYVAKAVELSNNPQMIIELKKRMRKNLIASSICNPIVFVRELELNFKKIWLEYVDPRAHADDTQPDVPADSQIQLPNFPDSSLLDTAISDTSRIRMAMIKLNAGEFDHAIEICKALVGNNGITPLALYIMGVARYKAGNPREAVENLKRSLQLNDKNTGAWKVLGEMYIDLGEISAANDCLKRIWEIAAH